ncbi:MAG: glycosyltransferase family 39 protein [Acidobacteriaceae bacterium]|nr:glycosyltransferase family 39 protein [Acidobacteriaceae bacterium]
MNEYRASRWFSTSLIFVLFYAALLVLHIQVLHLPYFWDEAGYYIPAARDLLLTGSLIPHSTVSNAHPPLVMAYLALAWKLAGFTPLVTRSAILFISAFTLLGVFRLAQRVANTEVAMASVLCTGTYPVFFAQSSLAHLDLAAAAFTIWGLLSYVEDRSWTTAVWFSLAVLTKETAIIAPVALLAFQVIKTADSSHILASRLRTARNDNTANFANDHRITYALLFPLLPLAIWYSYHWYRTGFIFGNPEFFRYNVQATLNPLRIVLALGLRLWQLLGYLGMYLLTVSTIAAMWLPAISDGNKERKRIAIDVQLSFLAVIVAYVLVLAFIGGAVLARYLLPVIPLVIIICVSTLRRRVRYWPVVVAIVAAAFVVGWFVNPPYGFSLEDNLAYRDYIEQHEHAENFIQTHYPTSRVLTAWPASDELNRPVLGYVTHPMHVFRIEDFTAEQLMGAAEVHENFDVALVFSTKYEPPRRWFKPWKTWERWNTQFFGYHRDVPPEAAAQILRGDLVYSERRRGQWIGVIEMQQWQEARGSR